MPPPSLQPTRAEEERNRLLEEMKKKVAPPSTSKDLPGTPVTADNKDPQFSSKHAKDIKEKLTTAIRINESSNTEGESALQSLGKQRETIKRSIDNVETTHDNLRLGRRVIRDMKYAFMKEKVIKGLIIFFLLLVIFVIIYVKWIRRKG